jgi:hypothetical protein
MLAPPRPVIVALLALSAVCAAQQGSLTDEEVATAIRLGQQGKDFSVRVGTVIARAASCAM